MLTLARWSRTGGTNVDSMVCMLSCARQCDFLCRGRSFFSWMNGPVFVDLPNAVRCISHISNPFWANDLEETGVHGENDGPHGPTVDEAIITLDLCTVHDNVGRKVVGGPAHCLFSVDQEKKDGDSTCQLSSGGAGEGTLSIVRVPSTTLARPKSATLRTGRSSCARNVLRNRIGVRGVRGENSTETAHFGFEIAMCDALRMGVLQVCDARVGRKRP